MSAGGINSREQTAGVGGGSVERSSRVSRWSSEMPTAKKEKKPVKSKERRATTTKSSRSAPKPSSTSTEDLHSVLRAYEQGRAVERAALSSAPVFGATVGAPPGGALGATLTAPVANPHGHAVFNATAPAQLQTAPPMAGLSSSVHDTTGHHHHHMQPATMSATMSVTQTPPAPAPPESTTPADQPPRDYLNGGGPGLPPSSGRPVMRPGDDHYRAFNGATPSSAAAAHPHYPREEYQYASNGRRRSEPERVVVRRVAAAPAAAATTTRVVHHHHVREDAPPPYDEAAAAGWMMDAPPPPGAAFDNGKTGTRRRDQDHHHHHHHRRHHHHYGEEDFFHGTTTGGDRGQEAPWEVVPPPPGASFGAAAPLYSHFSETCGAPLTSEAADTARASGHDVVALTEAYGDRLGKLRQLMMAKLLPRRDRLAAASRWVSERREALERTYERTDAETRRDADEVLGRLREAYQARTSEMRRAADQLRAEVEAIDSLSLEVSNAAEALVGTTTHQHKDAPASATQRRKKTAALMSMVGLIHRYPELCHDVEATAARPTPHVPDADPGALPTELSDRLEAAAANRGWAEALDLKDELLWELQDRAKAAEAKLAAEKDLTEEYSAEIAHWVQLTRELQAELDKTKAHADRTHHQGRDLRKLAAENGLLHDENQHANQQMDAMRHEIRRLKQQLQSSTKVPDLDLHDDAP